MRHPADLSRLTRRQLIKTFGATAATVLSVPAAVRPAFGKPVFLDYPFQLGVAAGDPAPDGFVIWTRLAPKPLEPGFGMGKEAVEVEWEVATDSRFRDVVGKGTATAWPYLGHAVHVEVGGLQPGREYHYRFVAGDHRTIPGRARTAPALGAAVQQVRFAVVGCQHYDAGFYTAYRHMAQEQLDFVYHYGDYIYEGPSRPFWFDRHTETNLPVVRRSNLPESVSLDDYRLRYGLYKSDPDLQMAHAAAAWVHIWDDHEVVNNWVGEVDDDVPADVFRLRRVAAAQAFYEHMPLRRSALPLGPDYKLYRRLAFGDLLDLNVLDTRLYRSNQPCGDGFKSDCKDADLPDATVLGGAQEGWLFDGMAKSRARWQVLAQQIMMMPVDREPGERVVRNLDSWDAYSAARARLLRHLDGRKLRNTVVLTGDEHQNFAGELKLDPRDPNSPAVATEFVTTSISSGGDGGEIRRNGPGILQENPHIKLLNDQRGYTVSEVTPDRYAIAFKVLDKVSVPGGALSTRATYAVDAGRPGLAQA